jgi:hypothetical protein
LPHRPLLTSEPKTDAGVGTEYATEDSGDYQPIVMEHDDEEENAHREDVKGAYLSFCNLGYVVKDDKKQDLPLLTVGQVEQHLYSKEERAQHQQVTDLSLIRTPT